MWLMRAALEPKNKYTHTMQRQQDNKNKSWWLQLALSHPVGSVAAGNMSAPLYCLLYTTLITANTKAA